MGSFGGDVWHEPRIFTDVLTPLIAVGVKFQAQPISIVVAAEAGVLVTGAGAEIIILVGAGVLGGHFTAVKIGGCCRRCGGHFDNFGRGLGGGQGGRRCFLNDLRRGDGFHRGGGRR